MSNRWVERRRHDAYYRRAKREGYHSRAAYKLKEIDARYRVMRPGGIVVDLGAAPGGWSQVAKELVGPSGIVISVDVKPVTAQNVVVVRGDMIELATLEAVRQAAGGPVETVISDMSPNITGHYSMDHAKSVHLAETALDAGTQLLAPGGALVVKVFQGDLFKQFYDRAGRDFDFHVALMPKATRKGSSEAYIICKRFRGRPR